MLEAIVVAVISTCSTLFGIGVAYGKLRGELNLISYRMQRLESIVGISHYAEPSDVEARIR